MSLNTHWAESTKVALAIEKILIFKYSYWDATWYAMPQVERIGIFFLCQGASKSSFHSREIVTVDSQYTLPATP